MLVFIEWRKPVMGPCCWDEGTSWTLPSLMRNWCLQWPKEPLKSSDKKRHVEFLKVHWDSIKNDMLALFNQMYLDVRIMEQLKHGTLMCIPMTEISTTPADCRTIAWLKTGNKILARFRTNRMRPTIFDMLHPSQDCGQATRFSTRCRRYGTR